MKLAIRPVAVSVIASGLTLGLATMPAFADTTARLHTHVTLSAMLADMAQQMAPGGHSSIPKIPAGLADSDINIFVSGNQARFGLPMDAGAVLMNLGTQKLTFLDTKTQHYRTVNLADLQQEMQSQSGESHALPPKAAAELAQFHLTTTTTKTGKTDTILGVPVEETLVTANFSMQPNSSGGAGAGIGAMGGMGISGTLALHFWEASSAASSTQIAELRQFMTYYNQVVNPAGAVQQMVGNLPGAASQFGDFIKTLESTITGQVILRSEVDVTSPFLSAMVEAAAASKGVQLGVSDPNAPLASFTSEMTSLSGAPVPASEFTIPAGYTVAPKETHTTATHAKKSGTHKGE